MAHALRVESHPTMPAGVVRSSRRSHLAVVTSVPAPSRPRPAAAQFRRRRRLVAFGALSVVIVSVFAVSSWADRRIGEPLGDPRPPIPWAAPLEHRGS